MSTLLDRWANDAPSEIRSDVGIIVDTMKGFFELLEENDFDFMAVALAAEDDPRLAALDSTKFNAATDRLDEYCGYDIEAAVDTGSSSDSGSGSATAVSGSGSSATGGFTQGTRPEDFPETLIPPDSTIGAAGDFGVGSADEFTSTATLNDVIEFYKDELGDPMLSSSEGTLWSVIDGTKATSVTISGSDGDVQIVVTSSTP